MRLITLSAAIAILAGCSILNPAPDTPGYDQSAGVIQAENHPISKLQVPDGFQVVRHPSTDSYTGFTFEDQQARLLGLRYYSDDHQPAPAALEAEGYTADSRQGLDLHYRYENGLFENLVPDPGLVPKNAPECAAGIVVVVNGRHSEHPMMAGYLEGQECDQAVLLDAEEKAQLKATAYQLLGLN